jgi:para-nitrobenzyl esterase
MIGRRGFLLGSAMSMTGLFDTSRLLGAPLAGGAEVKVAGGVLKGRAGGRIRAFTNVPFGRIPARFRAPEPEPAWTGAYDATGVPLKPVQGATVGGKLAETQSEDCLKLNIWAPDGPGPYPVLAYIFGGGNIGGAIGQLMYDGSAFAKAGIVFVAIQYRVGVMGFLELGGALGEYGTGNNAIRDQILGLEWIRDNIAAFGGDPKRVTLSGQSAGGGDAMLLATLPRVQKMIHRLIVVSGGGGKLTNQTDADGFAGAFIQKLGGRDKLRTASAAQILDAQGATFAAKHPGGIRPLLDGQLITRTPLDAFAAGDMKHIPLMAGYMRDEMAYTVDRERAANIQIASYPAFNYIPDGKRAEIAQGYAQLLPKDAGLRNIRILSADTFKIPALTMLESHARSGGSAHCWATTFAPAGCTAQSACKNPGLAVHGADLPLVFRQLTSSFAKNFGYTDSEPERLLAQKVNTAWCQFVKGEALTMGDVAWTPFNAQTRATMIIDGTSRMMNDPIAAERKLWVAAGAMPG